MYGNGLTGVSFQPGQGPNVDSGRPPSSGSGVQEAIKILSLRYPRVLGAQPAASLPLLTSRGSGGDPGVDGVLERAWQKIFGAGGPGYQQPTAPVMPTATSSGPQFSGAAAPSYQPPRTTASWGADRGTVTSAPSERGTPRVVVESLPYHLPVTPPSQPGSAPAPRDPAGAFERALENYPFRGSDRSPLF